MYDQCAFTVRNFSSNKVRVVVGAGGDYHLQLVIRFLNFK